MSNKILQFPPMLEINLKKKLINKANEVLTLAKEWYGDREEDFEDYTLSVWSDTVYLVRQVPFIEKDVRDALRLFDLEIEFFKNKKLLTKTN